MSENNEILEELKAARSSAMITAEIAAHQYAVECDIGEERVKAFEIHENIRNAGRVYE